MFVRMESDEVRGFMYYLIDSGGSKTVLYIKQNGQTVAVLNGGGWGTAEDNEFAPLPEFDALFSRIEKKYREPEGILINLGGKNDKQVRRTVSERFPSAKVGCYRESGGAVARSLIKSRAATRMVMAGTGSIAFGYNRVTGEMSVCGGWGAVYSDGGSGFDIGLEAVRTALEELDGCKELSMITKALTGKTVPIGSSIDVGDICAQRDAVRSGLLFMSRAETAALTKTVADCADKGDTVSLEILKNAGARLGRLAVSAMAKSGAEIGSIIISGGLVNISRYWLDAFVENSKIAAKDVILLKDGIIEGLEAIYQSDYKKS